MEKLHLKIRDKETYKHLIWFLNRFDRKELEILETGNSFDYIQEELQHERGEIDSGKSSLIDLEELDKEVEKIISPTISIPKP